MNQVSPRIFEAIFCGTALILFDGEYSGVVKPDLHFIPLRKDFSNLEEVFKKLEDDDEIQLMTDRAFEEVIGSGRYSFSRFISNFDLVLDAQALKKSYKASCHLFINWEVISNPVRTKHVPSWLRSLWLSIPQDIRLRMKPLVRRAWDLFQTKLDNR
jgi:hypothetical protein